jgi:hypothetical protein
VDTGTGRREIAFHDRLTQSSYHPEWFQRVFQSGILDKDRDEADRNFAEAGVLVGIVSAVYRSARAGGQPIRPQAPAETGKDAQPRDVYSGSGVSAS